MENLFFGVTVFGTSFFIIKILFFFLGDIFGSVDGMNETDHNFKVFSTTSLTGFFMMFGWVALSCFKEYAFSSVESSLCGLLAGLIAMFVVSLLFKLATLFIGKGSVLDVNELLGKQAVVYQNIPALGIGKIQVSLNGYPREVLAVSDNKVIINSFERVVVVKTIDKNTVSVKPGHPHGHT